MDHKEHPHIRMGLTLFLSLSATVLFVFILFRHNEIFHLIRSLLGILSPIFTGFAISYILRPMALFWESLIKRSGLLKRFARPIAVLLTVIIAVCLVALFVGMIVPELSASIRSLVVTLPDQIEEAVARIETYLRRDPDSTNRLLQMVSAAEDSVMNWLEGNLINSLGTIANNIVLVGSFLLNLVMSIIVAVYLLMSWERYLAQGKKLFLAISRNQRFNELVFSSLEQTNVIFSGFINGKLLDSLIVGGICFMSLSVMRMPYTLLISVVVCVTNIIPVFGPFIGAIPSAFLVLLVSPPKCLAFLIFIVILQQIDGNIIGPRILGSSTGLSALYVMTAMLIFGKLLGFVGMVIGVPLFATLYFLIKRAAEYSLQKQKLPLETSAYMGKGLPKEKD